LPCSFLFQKSDGQGIVFSADSLFNIILPLITRIIESLNKASGILLEENWYLFDYADGSTAKKSPKPYA